MMHVIFMLHIIFIDVKMKKKGLNVFLFRGFRRVFPWKILKIDVLENWFSFILRPSRFFFVISLIFF